MSGRAPTPDSDCSPGTTYITFDDLVSGWFSAPAPPPSVATYTDLGETAPPPSPSPVCSADGRRSSLVSSAGSSGSARTGDHVTSALGDRGSGDVGWPGDYVILEREGNYGHVNSEFGWTIDQATLNIDQTYDYSNSNQGQPNGHMTSDTGLPLGHMTSDTGRPLGHMTSDTGRPLGHMTCAAPEDHPASIRLRRPGRLSLPRRNQLVRDSVTSLVQRGMMTSESAASTCRLWTCLGRPRPRPDSFWCEYLHSASPLCCLLAFIALVLSSRNNLAATGRYVRTLPTRFITFHLLFFTSSLTQSATASIPSIDMPRGQMPETNTTSD